MHSQQQGSNLFKSLIDDLRKERSILGGRDTPASEYRLNEVSDRNVKTRSFTDRGIPSIGRSSRASSASMKTPKAKDSEVNRRLKNFKLDIRKRVNEIEVAKANLKENKLQTLHEISNEFEKVFEEDERKLMHQLEQMKRVLNELQLIESNMDAENDLNLLNSDIARTLDAKLLSFTRMLEQSTSFYNAKRLRLVLADDYDALRKRSISDSLSSNKKPSSSKTTHTQTENFSNLRSTEASLKHQWEEEKNTELNKQIQFFVKEFKQIWHDSVPQSKEMINEEIENLLNDKTSISTLDSILRILLDTFSIYSNSISKSERTNRVPNSLDSELNQLLQIEAKNVSQLKNNEEFHMKNIATLEENLDKSSKCYSDLESKFLTLESQILIEKRALQDTQTRSNSNFENNVMKLENDIADLTQGKLILEERQRQFSLQLEEKSRLLEFSQKAQKEAENALIHLQKEHSEKSHLYLSEIRELKGLLEKMNKITQNTSKDTTELVEKLTSKFDENLKKIQKESEVNYSRMKEERNQLVQQCEILWREHQGNLSFSGLHEPNISRNTICNQSIDEAPLLEIPRIDRNLIPYLDNWFSRLSSLPHNSNAENHSANVDNSSNSLNVTILSSVLDPYFQSLEMRLSALHKRKDLPEQSQEGESYLQTFGDRETPQIKKDAFDFCSSIGQPMRKHDLPISLGRKQFSVQTENHDENLFPPFDHRVCLRCKSNDMKSPGFCRYASINNLNGIQEARVHRSHVYGMNIEWRTQKKFLPINTPISERSLSENGSNTILSFKNVSNM